MSKSYIFLSYVLHLLFISTFSSVHYRNSTKGHRHHVFLDDGPNLFVDDVKKTGSKTDKIQSHAFQTMYGMFLYQIRDRAFHNNDRVKMLEVGLGCGMPYGPGESIPVWQYIFGGSDTLELWVTDIDKNCIEDMRKQGKLEGVHTLVGDQNEEEDMMRWATESGGNFSVIIDDGGHKTHFIMNTFNALWNHALAPGGLYFIEDLFVQRFFHDSPVFAEILGIWIEQLLMAECQFPCNKVPVPEDVLKLREKYPLPKGIKFILCQKEACMLAKCNVNDRHDMCSH